MGRAVTTKPQPRLLSLFAVSNSARRVFQRTTRGVEECQRLLWHAKQLSTWNDGPHLFGLFTVIAAIASTCPIAFVLMDDDGPIDARELSARSGFSEEAFARAIVSFTEDEPRLLTRYDVKITETGHWSMWDVDAALARRIRHRFGLQPKVRTRE